MCDLSCRLVFVTACCHLHSNFLSSCWDLNVLTHFFFFSLGYYCVGGVAVPCPAGTYGSKEGLQRLRDCTICPAGRLATLLCCITHCSTLKDYNFCRKSYTCIVNVSIYLWFLSSDRSILLIILHDLTIYPYTVPCKKCSSNFIYKYFLFLKGFTVWKAAHGDPPLSSCAHRAITVKKAPPPLMGHLALLVQQGNNWVRQVGQPVRDVEKDASVLQVSLSTDSPASNEQQILKCRDTTV